MGYSADHDVQRRAAVQMMCSTCGRRFLLDESPTPPFCSERCQLIDLGRWLDEEIGVPHEGGAGDAPDRVPNTDE